MLCASRLDFPCGCKKLWTTIFTFIFFCAGGSDVESLKFVSDPKQPLVGSGDKGDLLKLNCSGFIKPDNSSLTIDIFHTSDQVSTKYVHKVYSAQELDDGIHDNDISCSATESLCEGFETNFWYNNGNLTVVVTIAHLQCKQTGRWTCAVTWKPIYLRTEEKSVELCGFSPPSNIQITASGASGSGTLIALSGTKVVFTCKGNVGSSMGRFAFETLQHHVTNEKDAQEEFNPTEQGEYQRFGCMWIRKATLQYTVLDSDDHKSFMCVVSCPECEHEYIFSTNARITVYIVNTDGTTWHALDTTVEAGIANPLESKNASSTDTSFDCSQDVWLIFGVAAGGIIVLVVILESIFYLRKKTHPRMWYGF